MASVCRRCYHFSKNLYRVTTKDGDVVLLNMLVCPSCARLARSLGLATVKMEAAKTAANTSDVQAMTDSKQQPAQPPTLIR
jgi:hypothetical protein